jgi:hypothetical protein
VSNRTHLLSDDEDRHFNEVFERRHGAAARAYYASAANAPRFSRADIGNSYYELTCSRNCGASKCQGGAE